MRYILFIIIFISLNVFATQQQNDVIEYKGIHSELDISWSSPSPLEAYFVGDKKKDYPFEELHTANYRGHIATWQIIDKKLILTEVVAPASLFRSTGKAKPIKLTKILPGKYISENKAFAGWFTGHLLIKSTPFEKKHKSEFDGEEYFVKDFREYSIIRIDQGNVISEKSYDSDNFWSLSTRYYSYKSISKDDLEVISSLYNYKDSFVSSERGGEAKKVVHSEEDFDFFIERRFIYDVNVPLSEICIVKDVSMDPVGTGWFSESDFNIKKGSSVLYLEMGSTNIPSGPWDDFTGGSVQVLIPIEIENGAPVLRQENTRYINNFANSKSTKSITVDIALNDIQNEFAHIKGKIELASKNPDTIQAIKLSGKEIPVYSLLDYLKKHQDDNEYFKYDADEVFEKIQSRSSKRN